MWTVKLGGDKPYYFLYDDPKDYYAWSKYWGNRPNRPKFEMLGFISAVSEGELAKQVNLEACLEWITPEDSLISIYPGKGSNILTIEEGLNMAFDPLPLHKPVPQKGNITYVSSPNSNSKIIDRYLTAKEQILKQVQPTQWYFVFLNNKFEGLNQGSKVLEDVDKNKSKYFDRDNITLQLVAVADPIQIDI